MRLKYWLRSKRFWALIVLFILIINFCNGYFSDAITLYTAQKAKLYSEEIIDTAIKNEVLSILDEGPLMIQKYDDEGKVTHSYLDTYKSNLIKSKASISLIDAIKTIDNHEDFKTVNLPLGYFFTRNYFLSNGIKVPINLEVIGSQKIDYKADVVEYGINNSLVEISLQVSVEIQVAIPFQKDVVVTESSIPLSIEIINNDVPNIYFNQ